MKPYCIAPFVHLYQHNSKLDDRVCCISKVLNTPTDTDIKTKWSSDYYKDIRQRMLTPGSKLPECTDCIELEKKNATSDRQHFAERFKDYDLEYNIDTGTQYNKPIDFDLRPGNLCNLGCRMCSPVSSSQLSKEFKNNKEDFYKVYQKDRGEYKFYVDYEDGCDWDYEENLQYIGQSLLTGKTNRIKFLGGEPTIMPGVLSLMDFMIDHNLTDTELFFTTNCTNENKKFMEKLNKFKNLHFHFSIDGINKTLEYIRWPANWRKVNDNIQTFSKHKAECNITIQAYNIHNLKDFLYWVKSLNTVGLNTVELTQPRWFSYTVLPLDYRNKYLEQLYTDPIMNWSVASESNLKARVETMLNNSEVHNTDLFVQHTKTFDKVRKQYIGDYIPELETIVYG